MKSPKIFWKNSHFEAVLTTKNGQLISKGRNPYKISLVFWLIWRHQNDTSKSTDLQLSNRPFFLPINPVFFFGNTLGRARLGEFCTFFSCIFILLNVCIKSPGFPLIDVFQCMFLENRNRLQLYIHTQYPIAKQKCTKHTHHTGIWGWI